MLGTYYFKYAVKVYPVLCLAAFTMRVEIVNQTEKRYQIKYLNWHPDGSRPGSLHWVQKRKVRLDIQPRYTEIKLPYKD